MNPHGRTRADTESAGMDTLSGRSAEGDTRRTRGGASPEFGRRSYPVRPPPPPRAAANPEDSLELPRTRRLLSRARPPAAVESGTVAQDRVPDKHEEIDDEAPTTAGMLTETGLSTFPAVSTRNTAQLVEGESRCVAEEGITVTLAAGGALMAPSSAPRAPSGTHLQSVASAVSAASAACLYRSEPPAPPPSLVTSDDRVIHIPDPMMNRFAPLRIRHVDVVAWLDEVSLGSRRSSMSLRDSQSGESESGSLDASLISLAFYSFDSLSSLESRASSERSSPFVHSATQSPYATRVDTSFSGPSVSHHHGYTTVTIGTADAIVGGGSVDPVLDCVTLGARALPTAPTQTPPGATLRFPAPRHGRRAVYESPADCPLLTHHSSVDSCERPRRVHPGRTRAGAPLPAAPLPLRVMAPPMALGQNPIVQLSRHRVPPPVGPSVHAHPRTTLPQPPFQHRYPSPASSWATSASYGARLPQASNVVGASLEVNDSNGVVLSSTDTEVQGLLLRRDSPLRLTPSPLSSATNLAHGVDPSEPQPADEQLRRGSPQSRVSLAAQTDPRPQEPAPLGRFHRVARRYSRQG